MRTLLAGLLREVLAELQLTDQVRRVAFGALAVGLLLAALSMLSFGAFVALSAAMGVAAAATLVGVLLLLVAGAVFYLFVLVRRPAAVRLAAPRRPAAAAVPIAGPEQLVAAAVRARPMTAMGLAIGLAALDAWQRQPRRRPPPLASTPPRRPL